MAWSDFLKGFGCLLYLDNFLWIPLCSGFEVLIYTLFTALWYCNIFEFGPCCSSAGNSFGLLDLAILFCVNDVNLVAMWRFPFAQVDL